METKDNGRPLPKFGEWNVKDPASAKEYSVIFRKAKDDKKTGESCSASVTYTDKTDDDSKHKDKHDFPKKRKWLCCGTCTKI